MTSPRLASLPRHQHIDELRPILPQMKASGYTGIWIENEELPWTVEDPSANREFQGNWKLMDLDDLTAGPHAADYDRYFDDLGAQCLANGLDLCLSLWLPRLSQRLCDHLRATRPKAIGKAMQHGRGPFPTLCTCADGEGLAVIRESLGGFLRRHPAITMVKVATEDNSAICCDPDCPNAHGSTRAEHAGNLFATVEQTIVATNPRARLMLYPWFWEANYRAAILPRLTSDYLVVAKVGMDARGTGDGLAPCEGSFDCTLTTEGAGPKITEWVARVGADRVVAMLAVRNSVDSMWVANPPYPGRLWRTWQDLRRQGVAGFLDFECGGWVPGSANSALKNFVDNPDRDQATALVAIARDLDLNPQATGHAIAGWNAMDRAWGLLPITLGETGVSGWSSRFGFAWSMAIATPLLMNVGFGGSDRGHAIHWFSPYHFFNLSTGPRVAVCFQRVLAPMTEALHELALAAGFSGNEILRREAVAAQALVWSVQSALLWCAAPERAAAGPVAFAPLRAQAIDLATRMRALRQANPWVWTNNCWHQDRTPQSQRGLAAGLADHPDCFTAAISAMEQEAAARPMAAGHVVG